MELRYFDPGLATVSRLALAALAVCLVIPSPAATQTGPWSLEGVAGIYVTDINAVVEPDEDPAFGFRLVRDTGSRWSFEGQVLRLAGDRERDSAVIQVTPPRPTAIEHASFDFEAIAVDLSARLRLLPEDSSVQLHALAGPGWAFVDAELRFRPAAGGPGFRFSRGTFMEDSLTAHAGLALSYDLDERWYLRLDARTRWWDERKGIEDFDREYTVGVGFRF